jgi:hypothetical protein
MEKRKFTDLIVASIFLVVLIAIFSTSYMDRVENVFKDGGLQGELRSSGGYGDESDYFCGEEWDDGCCWNDDLNGYLLTFGPCYKYCCEDIRDSCMHCKIPDEKKVKVNNSIKEKEEGQRECNVNQDCYDQDYCSYDYCIYDTGKCDHVLFECSGCTKDDEPQLNDGERDTLRGIVYFIVEMFGFSTGENQKLEQKILVCNECCEGWNENVVEKNNFLNKALIFYRK